MLDLLGFKLNLKKSELEPVPLRQPAPYQLPGVYGSVSGSPLLGSVLAMPSGTNCDGQNHGDALSQQAAPVHC